MSKKTNFSVFILTNNRPDNCITIRNLRIGGYTGKIYLILDNYDKSIDLYKKNYSNDCDFYIFDKDYAISITDSADNTNNPKAVVYARNMCHEIANKLNIETFLVLDDNYTTFGFSSDNNDKYIGHKRIKNLDNLFSYFCNYLEKTNINSIAFSQGGDFIGGFGNKYGENITLYRKVMNSFFCRADRPFQFYGLINEDTNCYVLDGSRGLLYFTNTQIRLEQKTTQQNDGGLTTIYLEMGTYIKSFYTVIYHPSSVCIKEMGVTNKRLHHSVNWDYTVPKILNESFKKIN